MRKSQSCLVLFALILVAYAVLPLVNVQASPYREGNPNRWHSRPTTHTTNTTAGTFTLTLPGNAYDLSNATAATATWGGRGGQQSGGYFDMKTCKTPTLGTGATATTISQVDIKIRISSTGNAYGSFQVYYQVYPINTRTNIVTFSGSTALPTTDYVVSNAAEPNNGVWTWTDISNIHIVFQATGGGSGGGVAPGTASIYMAWATVKSPNTQLTVDPASIVGAYNIGDVVNFNVKINEVYDLYGCEFNLTWNPNILGIRDYWADTSVEGFLGDVVTTTGKFLGTTRMLWNNASGTIQNDVSESVDTTATGIKTGSITFPTAFSGTPDVYLIPNVLTEYIYKDQGTIGTVDAGDTRLTKVGAYDAGSIVAGGETDIGSTLVAFAANEKHRDTGPTANVYDVDEPIYRDVDASGTVTAGDVRLSRVTVSRREYFAGTYVEATHSDVGSALVAFAANEKHRENILADNAYDPVLTIRDLKTTAVSSTGFSWSFNVITAQASSSITIAYEANYASFMYISMGVPLGTPAGGGKSGTGAVATISFRVRGGGTTTLTLKDVKMSDSYVEEIPFTTVNGTFQNTSVVPEFPLGAALEIAMGIVIATFVWKRRKTYKIKQI